MIATSKGTVDRFGRIPTTPPLNDNIAEVYLEKTVPTTPPLDESIAEVEQLVGGDGVSSMSAAKVWCRSQGMAGSASSMCAGSLLRDQGVVLEAKP